MPDHPLDSLLGDVKRCAVCEAHLPLGPRPVVQMSSSARLLIIGQAPGSKVHANGVPWRDDSGHRLREWLSMDDALFYDVARVALMPMGFCYPGGAGGADLPPRPECAPLWHDSLLALMPERRLTLLVGQYTQRRYLRDDPRRTLTETVRAFRRFGPAFFPLPHPSWRSSIWMRRNPWFETEVLPALRAATDAAVA